MTRSAQGSRRREARIRNGLAERRVIVIEVPRAFLITGIPGAGKSTVARILAGRLPRAAVVEAEVLQRMIVSGGLWPDDQPHDEAMLQLRQRAQRAAMLARAFLDDGFVPIIDDIIVVPERLAIYEHALGADQIMLVTLAPPVEVALQRDAARSDKTVGDRFAYLDAEQQTLRSVGIWLDTGNLTPEETVDAILAETR